MSGDEARVGGVIARWLRPRSLDGFALAGGAVTVRVSRIRPATIDPDGAVAVIRGAADAILAVGSGVLVRGLAQAILGGPAELPAPRPPTVAEQAVWALAVAAALDATGGGAASVEPSAIAPGLAATAGGAAIVEVVVDGIARGAAWLVVPAAVLEAPPPRLALDSLADRAAWLEAVRVDARVVIAHAALPLAELVALAPRDAIVVGAIGEPGAGALRVGRGELAVTIDADRVTVRAPYQRGRMDETLGDDLTVELAVSAGSVAVTARKLLELAPGEVLALGRPAGGQVELVVGRRVIGTGELIDVDGELAVRVVSVNPR